MRLSISSFPRKIILEYIIFAGAWIAFSDRLLVALISDPHSEGWLQTAKGWMFVAVSAFLLNALLRRELRIRQQAEAALRQSEQRYRRIVETIEEGIWIVDADNRTSFVNPKMAAMLGYSPEEMNGTSLFDYIDAEGQAITQANLERRRQGISEQIEAKLRHKDGSEIWALVASSPVEDEQGCYAGVLAAITDITERKLAERAVRESEERFRRLSEATFEGVGICAHDVIIDANVRLAEMLGYTRAELVGMPTDRLIAPESRELVRQQVQTDYQGSYEHLALRKDGSMFPVEVRSRPLPEQGPAMRVTIVQDISERWAAQQALTQSEQRFRAIFEQTTIGIALVNIAGHPIVSNPALQTFLGYSANELRDMTFAMFTHPEDVGSDVALFTELVNGIRESYQLEKRYIRKDGQIVWGRMTASLIAHDGDESILGIGMIEDITERKRIEQQYLESQKMEALGRLAGGVAHDFNNLLTVILGSSELLLNELGHNHPLSRDVVPIQNAGMHAAALTRQLLTFSRHQVRRLDIVNLNMVVLRMETLLRRSLGEDVSLVTELAPDLAEVQIDVSQLEQVLLNLAVNARDAMPSGGQLTIETANAVLDGSMSGVPHIMLAISDTGHGMDAAIQARIFEPFFTTKPPGKGTGLGLSTVYGIVRQNGGQIWVSSEIDRGTTFQIYLPQATELAMPSHALAELAVARQDAGTILLAEDEPLVRSLASRILRARGYQVLEAEDGASALQLASQHQGRIDVLLTDVIMPGGMSGPQLAEQLLDERPELRVLYMSGYTDSALAHHTAFDARQNMVQKPFTAADLAHHVWKALHTQE